ncbi:MAG: hypothetical protein FJ090_15685 [Deltaproteobacteria bacterium]|nr:hypothetical protein [Deltaproteobacteria bacterium]MBM4392562.1 hypothetical protein [Deltaproteobacteria bacterium]
MTWARLPVEVGATESWAGVELEVTDVVGCPQAEIQLAYLGGGRRTLHYDIRSSWGRTLHAGSQRLGEGAGALSLRFSCEAGEVPHHLLARRVLLHPAGCGGH